MQSLASESSVQQTAGKIFIFNKFINLDMSCVHAPSNNSYQCDRNIILFPTPETVNALVVKFKTTNDNTNFETYSHSTENIEFTLTKNNGLLTQYICDSGEYGCLEIISKEHQFINAIVQQLN
ncbi:hypothetical protein FNN08_08480 [Thalassomonas sp. M1454]|nr:hypothetical protein FNN08_08480 [Thalassomonas sp. M1454]